MSYNIEIRILIPVESAEFALFALPAKSAVSTAHTGVPSKQFATYRMMKQAHLQYNLSMAAGYLLPGAAALAGWSLAPTSTIFS